jgi:DNA invertase Pin-like site-specific DNA recombinase
MKRVNKSSLIRKMLDKGMAQSDIVRKLKVSPQLVYIVARNYGKLTSVKRGRPSRLNERIVLAKLWAILSEYRKAA